MPWIYSSVKPKANPPCPICHRNDQVGQRSPSDNYFCAGCEARFEARYEAAPEPLKP